MTTRIHTRTVRELTKLELRADQLPPGVCGRMQGVALTYNTPDAYGTMFAPGSLDRTRAEKLAAGKVKLLADHEGVTDCHVGVVRSLTDVGDAVVMAADLFDTAAGRAKLEYLKAVTQAGAFTGLSIGFYERASDFQPQPDGDAMLVYTEIELDEVSLTPRPAVPGAEVTGARTMAPDLARAALTAVLRALSETEARAMVDAHYASSGDASHTEDRDAHADTENPADTDSHASDPPAPSPVDMDRRRLAVRHSYQVSQ